MADPRDYKLDLSSGDRTADTPDGAGSGATERRPFVSVHFVCCGVYQRVYRDAEGKSYSGRCPRCGKPVRFVVGSGGTSARFFRVS